MERKKNRSQHIPVLSSTSVGPSSSGLGALDRRVLGIWHFLCDARAHIKCQTDARAYKRIIFHAFFFVVYIDCDRSEVIPCNIEYYTLGAHFHFHVLHNNSTALVVAPPNSRPPRPPRPHDECMHISVEDEDMSAAVHRRTGSAVEALLLAAMVDVIVSVLVC